MNTATALYLVENVAGITLLVAAHSAEQAAHAARGHWMFKEEQAGRPSDSVDEADTYAVGRIGTFEPGPSGAIMARGRVVQA